MWTIEYTDIKMEIDIIHKFHLLIEVDGDDMEKLYKDCELISDVLENFECEDIFLADSFSEKENLWKLRRSVSEGGKI